MFRAVWFLFKLSLAIAAIVIVLKNETLIRIDDIMGYEVEIQSGFAMAVMMVFLLIWTYAYRLWRAIVTVPAVMRRYRVAMAREKGYLALTQGLVAVAAGDAKMAEKYSKRAITAIPSVPLTRLLSAQTALLQGNAPRARVEFAALLEDDSAAMFGIRGLLNETLAAGNYKDALGHIRQAEKLQPKRLWVIRTLLDLETKNRDWLKALDTVRKAEKISLFDKKQAQSARQAIYCALTDAAIADGNPAQAMKMAEHAFSISPAFPPAALRLIRLYSQAGKRRAAIKTMQKAWQAQPHADIGTLWMSFAPPPKKSASPYNAGRDTYMWAQQLYTLNPDHRDSQRLIGHAAIDARLWREAREYLLRTLDYRALAKLERAETGNEAKAREWLETASDNPPDPKWICAGCGHVSMEWDVLCPSCHAFNAAEWTIPSADIHVLPPPAAAFAGDILSPPLVK